MVDLSSLGILVIQASQDMRDQLRTMLDGFDVTDIQYASTPGTAIRRLRERRFDVILCDYNLGSDNQDGQHLLEDLRVHKIIPLQTLFLMLSSENNYESVVGTAELAPNDYILKPLTPLTLHARIARAAVKREVFLPAYRLLEKEQAHEAIEYCRSAELQHPKYRIDLMRFRAETHAELAEIEQAEAVYQEVIKARDIPWARLGRARMLFNKGQLEEAETLLQGLVSERTNYLDAYDLLARTRERAGHLEAAQQVLTHAMEHSPKRVGRLRHFGTLATQAGHFAAAAEALKKVVHQNKMSEFRSPEDHVRLVRTQLLGDQVDEAAHTIHDLQRSMKALPGTDACAALSRALLYRRAGRDDSAREAASEAATAAHTDSLSLDIKHDIISACLDNGLESEAAKLASEILRKAEDQQTLVHTRNLFKQHGRQELSKAIEEKLHTEVRHYLERGAEKARAGDYDRAVTEMMTAVRKMPGNPNVLFNAALALLRHIEKNGWNERFAAQAQRLITRTRRLEPTNPRLEAITQFMQGLVRRYGIQPDALQRKSEQQSPGNIS